MVKKLMALVGMMAALLTVSVPAFAQPNATLSFELTVEGVPPADATFFGQVQLGEGGPGVCAPLTDPDGDGVYTGSASVPMFPPGGAAEPVSLPVRIVQGTGQISTPGGQVRCPEPLSVIKDFGLVQIVDRTLSASVSFPGNGGKELPKTGGAGSASSLALGAGALLLVVGGLLARRLVR